MSSAGTKVTKDPEAYKNPKAEKPGPILSDSLAAESLNNSGAFAANAPHRIEAGFQPAHGTTTNATDTSGATELAPAVDAQARAGGAGHAQEELDSAAGEGKSAGRGPTYNVGGGSRDGAGGRGSSGGGGANEARLDPAPTAVHPHRMPGSGTDRPRGKNLKEDEGFDGSEENASFGGEIGTERDPSRLAENKLQRYGAQSGADAGGGPRQKGITGDGQYDALKEEAA